jgi:hypothetical protein
MSTHLAIWLSQHLGVPDPLIGDLVEQYAGSRSRVWLWRQAIAAIVVENAKTIWHHKLVALRVLLLGGIAMVVAQRYQYAQVNALDAISVSVGNWLLLHGFDKIRWWYFYVSAPDAPYWIVYWSYFMAIAWTMGRLHRSYGPSMVLVLLLTALAMHIPPLIEKATHDLPFRQLRPFIISKFIRDLGAFTCIVIAGLASVRRSTNRLAPE